MKNLKTKVAGLDVQIIKFNPLQGGIVLGTTMKMFAPVIKDITKALGSGVDEEQQIEVLVKTIEGLFTRHTPQEVMDYLSSIVAGGYVIVKDKKIAHIDDIEALIGEDEDALYVLLMLTAASIKYNFAKFLAKLMPNQTSSMATAIV